MIKKSAYVPRAAMGEEERKIRSRLSQLIHSRAVIRGTLNPREITCGKANCKCVRGEKHAYLYLVVRDGGKLRQKLIPRSQEAEVRRWVEQYQEAQNLLEEISDYYWGKLGRTKE